MPITTLTHRKPDAYSVIPKIPRYYAFHATDVLLATIYANDGTWLADRAAIPLPPDLPTAENGTLIPSASREGAPNPHYIGQRCSEEFIGAGLEGKAFQELSQVATYDQLASTYVILE